MANGLFEAVRKCHFRQLQFLVESGISLNNRNSNDEHILLTALQIEDDAKRNRMVRYLIRNKASCHSTDHKTKRDIFLWSCFLGRTDEAKLILDTIEETIDFNKRDVFGRTALHYATMRGNCELTQLLCQKMAKFSLTVDVRDKEGFTPFLIAKRLGFSECEKILLEVGFASPCQFDQEQRKTGHDWELEGEREHEVNMSLKNRQQVSIYKTLGRLPALQRAQFDSSKVNVVKSWKDRKFLARSEERENPMSYRKLSDFRRMASHERDRRTVSMNDLRDLDEAELGWSASREAHARSMTPPTTAALLQVRRRHSVSMASKDEALRYININSRAAHARGENDSESNFSEPPETFRSSINDSLPELMTILQQQQCSAFRPKAIPRPVVHSQPRHRAPSRSTLAIIFKKDGTKKVVTKEAVVHVGRKNGRLSSIREETGLRKAKVAKFPSF